MVVLNPPERADDITLISFLISSLNVIIDRSPTGVQMLDNHSRRLTEFLDKLERSAAVARGSARAAIRGVPALSDTDLYGLDS